MKVDRKAKAEKKPPAVKAGKGRRRAAPKTNGKHPLAAYEHIPVGIVEASLDGNYMDVNEEFCRILGYSRQELLQLGIKDCTHEDDYGIDSKLYEQLIAGKIPFYRLEKRFLRKMGREIWVELTRTLVCDEKGKPVYTVGVVLDISDRKDVERVLRDSVERLRLATGAAKMFMWEWDFQNQNYILADNFEQVLGFSGGLLPSNRFETIWALSPEEDVQRISEEFDRAIEHQRDLHALPYRVINPENGQVVWLEISAKIVYDNHGKPERMFGVAQNITESKKTQDEIAIISKLPEQNPNPVMRITPDGRILYANNASASLLEAWSRSEEHPIPDPLQQAIADAFASGAKKEVEISYQGSYFACTLAPIREAGYINFYGKDITPRKRAEEALRSSEERMRLAIESSRMVAWEWEPATDRVTTSENVADVYGLSSVEQAATGFSLIRPEDLPAHKEKVDRVTREGGEYQSEFRVTRPLDGRVIWMEERATAITDAAGHVIRLVGVVTDITERKLAEEKLRESEERFRALVSQATAGIAQSDIESRLTFVNPRFCEMLGYSEQELLGKTIWELTYFDELEENKHLFQRMLAKGEPYQFEKRFIRRDGSTMWTNVSVTTIHDSLGKPKGGVGVMIDIEERRRAEAAVAEYARQQEALYKLSEHLHRADSPEDVYDAALDAILNALQCNRASILLYDNQDVMRFVAWRGLSDEYRQATDGHSPWTPDTKDPQPISMDDVRTADLEESLRAVIEREGIGALAFIPLVVNGKLIGKFMIYFNEPHPFTEGELDLCLTIAHQLAFGIDRNRTVQALKRERELLERLFETMPVIVSMIDPKDNTMQMNAEFERVIGWKSEEVTVPSLLEALYPDADYRNEVLQRMAAAANKNEWVEVQVHTRDERIMDSLWSNVSIFNEDGTLAKGIALGIDITERKQTEKRLALLAEISDMLRNFDDPYELMYAISEAIGEHLNVKRALFNEIDLEHDSEIVHRDYHKGWDSVAGVHRISDYSSMTSSEVAAGKTVVNGDSKTDPRTAQDYERTYAVSGERAYVVVPLMRDNRWVASLWVSDDAPRQWSSEEVSLLETVAERTWAIIEKLRINAELRGSEERLRATLDTTVVGFATLTTDTRFVEVNDAFCSIVGYPREELLGMDCSVLTHPDFIGSTNQHVAQLLAGEIPSFVLEKLYIRKDGVQIWVQNSVSLMRGEDGKPLSLVVICQDVTERKSMEEQLRAREAELEDVINQTPFMLTRCTRDLRYRFVSRAYAEMIGRTPEEVENQPIIEIMGEEGVKTILPYVERVLAGERVHYESGVTFQNVGTPFLQVVYMPDRDEQGKVIGWFASIVDISERKRAEERLRQSEERFRQAANASGALVYEVDLVVGTATVVHGMEHLVGYASHEMVGSSDWWHSLIHPDDLPTHLAQLETLLHTGGSDVCEYRVKHRNGHWIVVQDNRLIIQDDAGQFLRLVGAVIDITERKRIEEALRIENERFMRFVNSNMVGILIADPTGKVVLANDYYLNLLGLTRQDLAEGKVDWRKFTPPEWSPADEKAIRELRETGVCEPYEKEYVRTDGTRVPVYLADAMLPGPGEEIAAFAIDITERKRAEEALRRNEELFSTLMAAAPFGVYFIDSEFRLRAINKGSEEVFRGIAPLIGRDFAEVLRIIWQEPFATEAIERFRHTLRTGESYISPPSVEQRENIEEIQAYDWQIHRIILPDGSFGVVCYFYDLSEQKRMEAAVRESEQRFRNMADHAPVMVWVTDADGSCTYLSQSWYEFTGQTPETGLGEGWLGVVHPDDSESSQKIFSTANEKREAFRLEYRLQDRNGEYHWAIDSAQPRFSETGEFLGFIGSVIDIAERKRAEEALRKSEERYRGIVNQTIGGIAETDLTGKFVMVNDRYCEIVGYTREKLLNEMRMQDITHPDDQARNMELFKCLSSDGDSFEIEKRYVRSDGSLVWVHNSVSAITGADGKPQSAVAAVIDITERKLAEEQQRRSAEFDAFRVALVDALRLLNDPEEILAESLQVLGEKLGVDRVLYSEIAEDDETILILDNYVKEGVPKLTGRASLSDYGKARGPLSMGQNLIIVDAAISPDMDETDRESFAALGIRSGIGIPLIKGGRWAATLGVHHSSMRIWTENEVRFMEETAERTWSALERARAQEKLRASETLYRAIARNIPGGGVYVVDKDFRYLVAEGPVTDAFGLSRDMLEGRTVTDVFPDERGAQMVERLQRNFAGETVGFETNFNGRVYWTQQAPLLDSIGQAIILTLDITERKQAEEALRQSEERFARFMQQLPGLAWIKDIDGRYVYANAATEKAFNTPREELYGKTDEDIFPPEVAAQFRNNDVQALQDEKGIQVIETLEQADGVLHYSLVSKFPIPGPDGNTTLIGGTAFDITERLKAEDALRESEERFRALLRQATAGIVRKDAEGRLIFVNQAFCNMLGRTEAELLGKTMWDFMHEEDVAESTSSYERLMLEGIPFKLERRLRREDGSIIWVDASVSPIMDFTGKPHSAVAVEVDITARKRAEEALQQLNLQLEERVLSRTEKLRSVNQTLREEITERKKIENALRKSEAAARENEEKLSTLFRLLPVGISFLDLQGQILEMNPALANMLKLSVGHLADQSYRSRNYIRANGSLMPPTEFASRRALTEGKTVYNVETGVILEDGNVVWTSVSAAPVDVADVGVVVVTADITESKRAERALQESRERLQILSQRLVEVQEDERRAIARELHDRVGQTLAALNINLIIISGQLGGKVDEQVSTRLNDSMKLVAETIALVRDVMSNLRPSVLDDYGLEAAIESHLSQYAARYEIDTKFEKPTSPIPRLGPSIEMTFLRIAQEALMNIAKHARASQVTLRLDKEGNAVHMTVEDNGMGIESWQEANRPGSHGLTIMRERAEAFGGTLRVSSAPGKGTKVEVSIPVENSNPLQGQKETSQ